MSETREKKFGSGEIKIDCPKTSDFPRRAAESVLAAGGLVALAPLMLSCALLVRFSSPGAVIFRQRRVGRGGRLFTLYKFRTMFEAEKGALVTARGDSRITAVGRLLRKTKLDEMPQLFNILRGDMSFVGPRPEVPELVDLNDPLWRAVLGARPGITDPVTLEFRNEEDLLAGAADREKFYRETIQPYKLAGYVRYLQTKSALGDLKIVLQTLKVVVFPRRAPSSRLFAAEKIK